MFSILNINLCCTRTILQDSIPRNKSKLSLKLDTLKRTLGSGKLLLFRILKRRHNLYARCKLGMFYVNMLTFQFLPEAFRNNKFFAFVNVSKVIVYKSCDELSLIKVLAELPNDIIIVNT